MESLKKITLFLGVILLYSCVAQKNAIYPQINESGKLQLNGYYYQIENIKDESVVSLYFLYKNGVIYYQGTKSYSSESEALNMLETQNTRNQNIANKNGYQNTRGFWGVYKISNDSIFIKQQMLGPGKRILEKTGKIINSSTYCVSFERELGNGAWESLSKIECFHFKYSDSIPSGQNIFFK